MSEIFQNLQISLENSLVLLLNYSYSTASVLVAKQRTEHFENSVWNFSLNIH